MTASRPPQHGMRACYLRGCRHPACVKAHKRYCKEYELRVHQEGPRCIDASEAAAHVQTLISSGWSQVGLAEASGCKATTICELLSGKHKKIRVETAQALLAFQPAPDSPAPSNWTDPTGTVRRVQALAVMGHPMYRVAAAVGISTSHLRSILAGSTQKVSKTTARNIADVYGQLLRVPGTSSVTRGRARANGWHGPAAWADGVIDDPQARPEASEQEPPLSFIELGRYRRDEIIHLASFGVPEREIAERLGLARAYVHDLLRDLRKAAQADRKRQRQGLAA